MKNALFILAAVPLFLIGCESQEFEFVGTINTERTYLVDNSGTFDESAQINVSMILDSLDLPDGATIGDVNIESLAIMVEPLDGNLASSVDVSGRANMGGGDISLFDHYEVPVTDQAGSWISISGLAEQGITALREKFQQYLDGTNSAPFTVWATGYSLPVKGSRIHASITIRITCTVKYTREADVPWFIQGAE